MGGNIFSGVINGRGTALMMIGMLVFAVAWEAFTLFLDNKFEENKSHKEMLTKVYKELMILGVIAFGLIMGKEVGIIDWSAETLHCFEFCDLLVSICVLVYVANCAISSHGMKSTQREWDRMAMTETSLIMRQLSGYLDGVETSFWLKVKQMMPLGHWHDDADFKVLQMLFKNKFHLPAHFDYVQYIKLVLGDTVIVMANITTWHWVMIMLVNWFWWIGMHWVLPMFGMEAKVSPELCLFVECELVETQDGQSARRQLGGAAASQVCQAKLADDTCGMSNLQLETACTELQSNSSETSYWTQCETCEWHLDQKGFDLPMHQTRFWCVFYAGFGFLICLFQGTVLLSLYVRMTQLLTYCGVKEDPRHMVELLEEMQMEMLKQPVNGSPSAGHGVANPEARCAKLQPLLLALSHTLSLLAPLWEPHRPADLQANRKQRLRNDAVTDRTNVETAAKLHHRALVNVEGDATDTETDHVMVFAGAGKNGEERDSNDVMSKRKYEELVFITQFNQLVIDFYFSFYWIHMRKRVGLAWEEDQVLPQLFFHILMVMPVLLLLKMLTITTRKISLLVSVLHLDDDAVSQVLRHMEDIKSIRKRIHDTLISTTAVTKNPDHKAASDMLEAATEGEVAILRYMAKSSDFAAGSTDGTHSRITREQMLGVVAINADNVRRGIHGESLTLTADDIKEFVDRGAFKAYGLKTAFDQATAQTAKTLVQAEGDDPREDSIDVQEFCLFVLRFIADIINRALEKGPEGDMVPHFTHLVTLLDSIDDEQVQHAQELAKTKSIFRMTDKDGGGTISRSELYGALRKFRVPITRKEFAEIFRVIDPDQSRRVDMEEWIDFMMATDEDLLMQGQQAQKAAMERNAAKGSVYGELAAGTISGLTGGLVDGEALFGGDDNKAGKREVDVTDLEGETSSMANPLANPLAVAAPRNRPPGQQASADGGSFEAEASAVYDS